MTHLVGCLSLNLTSMSYYCDPFTDRNINAHLILLQLVPVRPFWRAMGSAAGLTEETLDLVGNRLFMITLIQWPEY